jgi:putative ABC transport system permease protein
MESLVADTIAAERFHTLVLGIFAGVAVILSAAGIYGVLSYWVNQRTSEIGVRMALGATRTGVLRNVVGHGMALTGLGVAAGLAGAVVSTRVLANSLFEVGARDPATFAAVTVVLSLVALLSCWVPARRASRVDPMTSLREE